jgi:hypothetical protein
MKAREIIPAAIELKDQKLVVQLSDGTQKIVTGFRIGSDRKGRSTLIICAGKSKPY